MQHRGILTQVALECNCSPQFVQAVAYNKSTALKGLGCRGEVETVLVNKGWPGVPRYNA